MCSCCEAVVVLVAPFVDCTAAGGCCPPGWLVRHCPFVPPTSQAVNTLKTGFMQLTDTVFERQHSRRRSNGCSRDFAAIAWHRASRGGKGCCILRAAVALHEFTTTFRWECLLKVVKRDNGVWGWRWLL